MMPTNAGLNDESQTGYSSYTKGILKLPEISDETREEFIKQMNESNEIPAIGPKSCPFCKHTTLLELYPKDRQRVAEYLWDVLLNDLYEIAKDTEDHKEIWVLDHRIRKFIRATRMKE